MVHHKYQVERCNVVLQDILYIIESHVVPNQVLCGIIDEEEISQQLLEIFLRCIIPPANKKQPIKCR